MFCFSEFITELFMEKNSNIISIVVQTPEEKGIVKFESLRTFCEQEVNENEVPSDHKQIEEHLEVALILKETNHVSDFLYSLTNLHHGINGIYGP